MVLITILHSQTLPARPNKHSLLWKWDCLSQPMKGACLLRLCRNTVEFVPRQMNSKAITLTIQKKVPQERHSRAIGQGWISSILSSPPHLAKRKQVTVKFALKMKKLPSLLIWAARA